MSLFEAIREGRPVTIKRRLQINWPIFLIGQGFWLLETAHFGWNVHPGSDAEVICDGIVLLITALSLLRSA